MQHRPVSRQRKRNCDETPPMDERPAIKLESAVFLRRIRSMPARLRPLFLGAALLGLTGCVSSTMGPGPVEPVQSIPVAPTRPVEEPAWVPLNPPAVVPAPPSVVESSPPPTQTTQLGRQHVCPPVTY